jgi:hypothetical protein
MSRAFYTEYVKHCLRFYVRHGNPKFHTEADKHNWQACEEALNTFSDSDREMLMAVYQGGDTIPDNIYQLAKDKDISQDCVWRLVNELERKVAKRRGLL